MFATVPHDLAPQLINPQGDWYSFAGNASSILGFLLSVIALMITISVKRQVRKIEREYVMRLKSSDWSSTLGLHADRLLTIYGSQPFATNDARVELAKISSLLKTLYEQVPPFLQKEAHKVLKKVEEHREPGWFRRAKPLDENRLFDLYLVLIEFGENLKHTAIRIENTPTR
jgi:hypothetical protein